MQDQALVRLYYNKQTLTHRSSKPHPEHPERINYIIDNAKKLQKNIQNLKVIEIKLEDISEQKQKEADNKIQEFIKFTHGQDYWEFVKQMWYEGIKKPEMYINMDTYFMKHTYHAAKEAVRTTITAIDELFSDKNTRNSSFAVVRPPGHHCGMKQQPHGFSFFNNLAVGINYAVHFKKSFKKVAIIDWDAHHGEGTQKIFYHLDNPLFISLHRYDNGKFFPHVKQSGSENIGEKQGEGYNVNICWNLEGAEGKKKGETFQREQTCGDEEYAYAFQEIVLPILKQYDPEAIFVSCGFDSAKGDSIGGLLVSETGYSYMTHEILKMNKKTLFVLQGGYTQESLIKSSQAVILTAAGKIDKQIQTQVQKLSQGCFQPNKVGIAGVDAAKEQIQKYWKLK